MTVSPIRLKAMREAIADGDEKKVRLLMKAGVDVAGTDEKGWPFIECAVINRHMHLVKLLEAEGADMLTPGLICQAIESRGGHGPSRELALYILNGYDLSKEELDGALLSAAGNGDLIVAQALIDRGADVNATSGVTFSFPLWLAVVVRDIEMVRLLLANGADPRKHKIRDRDDEGNVIAVGSLAEMAEISGETELAKLLNAA